MLIRFSGERTQPTFHSTRLQNSSCRSTLGRPPVSASPCLHHSPPVLTALLNRRESADHNSALSQSLPKWVVQAMAALYRIADPAGGRFRAMSALMRDNVGELLLFNDP